MLSIGRGENDLAAVAEEKEGCPVIVGGRREPKSEDIGGRVVVVVPEVVRRSADVKEGRVEVAFGSKEATGEVLVLAIT